MNMNMYTYTNMYMIEIERGVKRENRDIGLVLAYLGCVGLDMLGEVGWGWVDGCGSGWCGSWWCGWIGGAGMGRGHNRLRLCWNAAVQVKG